ncbi:AMP-binding protein [Brevundimonas bullata]|uniref:AMP-binding protein n=1 Tax=Brevundimonas bullata TaxID=13160 RepID=UPI000E0B23A5|nr:AMP-binding protein [Brevundimonas bullata]WQE37377.1 AMP-binding protein [Brevundimonas bullata]
MDASDQMSEQWRTAGFRDAGLMPVDLDVRREPDGAMVMRSRVALAAHDWNLPRAFAGVAARRVAETALARRDPAQGGAWSKLDYAGLKHRMDAVTQWLLDHPQHRGGPLMLMGANSPAMAAFLFGAMAAGVPTAPVSAHYALLGGDLGRLNHVIRSLKPSILLIEDARMVAGAIDALDLGDAIVITATPEALTRPSRPLSEVMATQPGPDVAASIEGLQPDQVAQFMMTSGSTGLPKVVPLSLKSVAANTAQAAQVIGEGYAWSGQMLGWMPWNHVAGAAVLRAVLLAGGAFYIDDGKPMPGLFEESIRNLRELPVRYYVNVPTGYAMLADALEADAELRRTFFSDLRVMVFGGAALSQSVSDRIQAMAVQETGHRIMLTSAYGATETTAGFMVVHQYTDRLGLGLPVPGVEVKLVPHDADKFEVRVRGPNVMAGYHDDAARTAEAFDADGYYRMGDLATLADRDDPAQGVFFAGRLADQFKLSTGSWVFGAQMREAALQALAPLAAEVVLCDDNRPWLGVLAWPSAAGIKAALDMEVVEAMTSGALAQAARERLAAHNASAHGASGRIARLAFLTTPPDPNAHEVSDKATINRRAVIDNRKPQVDALYAEPPGPGVVVA